MRGVVAAIMALGALGVVAYLAVERRNAEATSVLVAIVFGAGLYYFHNWAPGRKSG